MRNPADAEDIVQETFLRIHRTLARVPRTDRLTAWVFQVARNTIVDHYRRERRPSDESPAEVEAPAVVCAEIDDEPAAELKELTACLAPLVESRPPTDREAIELSELAGLTQREAATRAGVTLSGMKSRV